VDKLSVAYVTFDCKLSGVLAHLMTALRHLDRGRYLPVVYAIKEPGELAEEIRGMGVEVVVLGRAQAKQFDWPAVGKLASEFRRRKMAVVHAHFQHASRYAHLAAWRASVPARFTTVHDIMGQPKPKRNWINWGLSHIVDTVITPSKAVKEDLLRFDGIKPGQIEVVYYGIDHDRFHYPPPRLEMRRRLGLPEGAKLVGTAGRLALQKGFDVLLRAMPAVAAAHPEARLLLVGSGKLEGELRAEADRLGVAPQVDFLGTRWDMPELFAAMDCFVLPSKRDSFPVVLLEAAATGLPCVATDDGGNPESVIDGETGLIVPLDDPKALGQAVISVLDDPARARRWGEAGRAKVERLHTARVMMDRIEALYERTLAAKGLLPAASGTAGG
jgi:glycosyltransferase involved in cell wall biosynthesis